MSEHAITLTRDHVGLLRIGIDVAVDDDAGRMVRLYPWSGTQPRLGDALRVELSTADLDLIESQPEGLVVADETRTTGWAVRAEAQR